MGSLATAPPEEAVEQPTIEERRNLIERVAASGQFRRSARLRDFLLYVGHQSLKEGCPEIHEQEIGAKVFGRSPMYDRSQDNIVRVNATELRKRLHLYFEGEGTHETLVLDIPRGAYKPVFQRRLRGATPLTQPYAGGHAEPLQHATPEPSHPVDSVRRPTKLPHILWGAVTVPLAACCLFLLHQQRALTRAADPWKDKPAMSALWSDLIHSHDVTDIVLPDASVSISEEILHQPMPLPVYLGRDYIRHLDALNLSADRKADMESIFGHNLVAFGDFEAAEQFLNLNPRSSSIHLTLSRFFGADSLKRDSVILIGGKKANPWIQLFDPRMNFSLDFDNALSQTFVSNRAPKPGEQNTYISSKDSNAFTGYCVIAFLSNPSRTGNVLILAGTDSDATNAGAEFLTSEAQLSKLRKTLGGTGFPYFEVLLKTSRLSGTAFDAEVLSFRAYPNEPPS